MSNELSRNYGLYKGKMQLNCLNNDYNFRLKTMFTCRFFFGFLLPLHCLNDCGLKFTNYLCKKQKRLNIKM